MGKRGLLMTSQQVEAHQRHHGFLTGDGSEAPDQTRAEQKALPLPVKMTIPEKEMDLMLKVQQQKGEILEYRFHPLKLAWGVDPDTGNAMIYTPDFLVVRGEFRQNIYAKDIVLIETKGSKLFHAHLVRFRGCRACWPIFQFELHQRDKEGGWRRVE